MIKRIHIHVQWLQTSVTANPPLKNSFKEIHFMIDLNLFIPDLLLLTKSSHDQKKWKSVGGKSGEYLIQGRIF